MCGISSGVRETFLSQRMENVLLHTLPPIGNLIGCLALGSLKCLSVKGLIIFVCSYHPVTFRYQIQSLYFLSPGMLFSLAIGKFG